MFVLLCPSGKTLADVSLLFLCRRVISICCERSFFQNLNWACTQPSYLEWKQRSQNRKTLCCLKCSRNVWNILFAGHQDVGGCGRPVWNLLAASACFHPGDWFQSAFDRGSFSKHTTIIHWYAWYLHIIFPFFMSGFGVHIPLNQQNELMWSVISFTKIVLTNTEKFENSNQIIQEENA